MALVKYISDMGESEELAHTINALDSLRVRTNQLIDRKKELISSIRKKKGDCFQDAWIQLLVKSRNGRVDWDKLLEEQPYISKLAEKYRKNPTEAVYIKAVG